METRWCGWARRLSVGASMMRDMRLVCGMSLGSNMRMCGGLSGGVGMDRLRRVGCRGPLLLFDPTASGPIPLLYRRTFLIGQPGVCGGHLRVLGSWRT